MKGIHPSIASHKLNVFPAARPIRQKIRRFHPDRQRVIQDEINKLLEAGFIREVSYPDWLANVVVVPKKEGKWRVCVDYTNLNNACPKDSFPLPRIDQIVDSTSGQGMLSFLDAFSGYHQIPMSPDDEEKTAFITPHGLYCYKVMPFGLKNAGATYQRLMTKIFKPLIGRSVEVYIDDIVVKSKTREQHILHLQEVFYLLRKYDMKLNPSKCAFGVSAGKFLGFMVSQRGIEVSPDQVKAVMETPPPRNKKELQRLTGKLVALGRFIARFTDELRPFFLAIRKAGTQGWTDNCQNALERIKHCLMHPPILSSPIPKEKLYMYLAVSEWAISAVLFRCPSPKEQKPVYYVSRHWQIFNWANATMGHRIERIWNRIPTQIIQKRPSNGRLRARIFTKTHQHHESVNRSGGLYELTEPHAHQALEIRGHPVRIGPRLALSVSKLRIYSDSQLVVRHVQKEYEAKDSRMARYLAKVRSTLQQFTEWTIEKIKRADNGALTLGRYSCFPPIREAILLPIMYKPIPLSQKIPLATPLRQPTDDQEWTHDIAEYLRTGLYPKILNKRTKSGCKLPVSP
ncbi:Transposon Ty3-I Gag-Pol polyprotein [Vitis vinifera]|uniref:Transposon Ty3-I Gag-Pol polyprotein n=1 Tax=Vitis vinifera TaxID=29760 RepID=A0A438CI79_VITVI|nr:Transposon Ty3-I Gag-Pol polyprotein [Vitis vinifera]